MISVMPVLFSSTHPHKRRRIPHEYPVSIGREIFRVHPYPLHKLSEGAGDEVCQGGGIHFFETYIHQR